MRCDTIYNFVKIVEKLFYYLFLFILNYKILYKFYQYIYTIILKNVMVIYGEKLTNYEEVENGIICKVSQQFFVGQVINLCSITYWHLLHF